ncbi:MAG: hypothetical protein HYT70_04720 [Candidatus Aenigmarchaeota archaeon]|nr:hypothetical protein [Candidatus Aenigmarchaeota archaeon]
MRKKSSIKQVFSNTLTVVAKKNLKFFLAALVGFLLLYSFFYGIFVIPIIELGFFKDVKPGLFDYFYIAAASLMASLIVTLTRYSIQNKAISRGTSFLGMAAGAFAAVCPVCLGVNFLVLGSFITIPLVSVIPYLIWIQIAGLALLAVGVLLTVRFSYDNICIACTTTEAALKRSRHSFSDELTPLQTYAFIGITVAALLIFGYQLMPIVTGNAVSTTGSATSTDGKVDVDSVALEVLPEKGFTIDAKWGDSVSKMVKAGVLDVDKLDDIMTKRYGKPLTTEQKTLLTSDYSDEKLTINSDNGVFMMYVLWTLGKHNDNQILHDSPFAQYFGDYDIGVGKAGYGDTSLIELTPEQQAKAEKVAKNSYRPCCGNPTSAPDCSHGFSALGLVELMAHQGYSEEEMFDAFVKFNSYWFPATYIQDALYFKLAENKDWNDVDRELVAGKQYSSLSGSYAVKQYLQGLGL